MEKTNENILTIAVIIAVTILTIYILSSIPGYLRLPESNDIIGFQLIFILIFLMFNAITIGISAWIHRTYVNDYGKIKNVWFFALFGGITAAILGEVLLTMNPVSFLMIIPYTLLMFIYAQFYKRCTWWKVALTAYFGGIVIENGINRAPIQMTTLIWIGFFIYPYFVTKIYENRKKTSFLAIIKDLKGTIVSSVLLTALVLYIISGGPLAVFAAALPFLVTILFRHFKKIKPFEKKEEINVLEIIKDLRWAFLSSIVLILLAIYMSRNNLSPPLIIFGALLPFLMNISYTLIKKRK
ncbi:hypothetical protein HZA98_02075 [Candidatus Woesearchaeota archaeon]|nr:hypothetical protein [Candidatus Woesearchaeota archaeon]